MTDPIDIDISDNSTEPETASNNFNYIPEEKVENVKLPQEVIPNLKKSRLVRPKSPPPPIPTLMGKIIFNN